MNLKPKADLLAEVKLIPVERIEEVLAQALLPVA
jgi:hypothetical protein